MGLFNLCKSLKHTKVRTVTDNLKLFRSVQA